jgi:cyanophycin synthetase
MNTRRGLGFVSGRGVFPRPWGNQVKAMRIISFKTIHGPNVYHHLPVIVMKLDLGKWVDTASNEIPGFIEKLTSILPELGEHTCSLGYRGGFVERLHRGTFMGHIIEHVALEMSRLVGEDVSYGKTRFSGEEGKYLVIVRFHSEGGMKACLEEAFALVNSILTGKDFSLDQALKIIKQEMCAGKLGPSAESLMEAAKKRKIPVRRVGKDSLIYLGYGKKMRRVQAAVSDYTSLIAADIVQDKALTKEILNRNAVPVPFGEVVYSEEELKVAVSGLTGPFAVKPLDGHHGHGVALNLKSEEEMTKAFKIAKKYGDAVIVEKMCYGRDYRVLVVNYKMIAAAERRPPSVTGDGGRTILQLIDEINADPRREEGHSANLTKITIDEIMIETLSKHGFDLNSVPSKGQTVVLRENANLSSGGTAKDVTDEVHPQVKVLCERIARVVGLDICGIDVIHKDISQPPGNDLFIIEVNAGPGLRMHLAPSKGKARDVGDAIVEMLYPKKDQGRIPIISVTGTNGKTTTARLCAKILSDKDTCVGLTTSDGIWIGGERILSGDTTGPQSAGMILNDTCVDKAVLEVARGGLLRGGLAYDWSDVGIITNIRPDHIGQDGIEDLEDLVWIKSIVAERVHEDGTVVLNADDFESLRIRERRAIKNSPRNIFLYSMKFNNPDLVDHLNRGGDGCWVEDGAIYICRRGITQRLINVEEIPFTMGGMASFQVSNAMAAVAACISINTPIDRIKEGLRSFESSSENLGRFNTYKIRDGYLILDYGHNTDALTAVGEIVANFKNAKKTAVVSLPGDRADEILRNAATKISQYFDRIIVKDDVDLRGRKTGEIPKMMAKTIVETNPQVECIIIEDQTKAIETALSQISKNEIVAVFYDSLDAVMKVIRQFDPLPVSNWVEEFKASAEVLGITRSEKYNDKEKSIQEASTH